MDRPHLFPLTGNTKGHAHHDRAWCALRSRAELSGSRPCTASADLLTTLMERVRPMLMGGPTKQRIRILWAATKQARNLGAGDVVHDAFVALAIETALIDGRSRWTGTDVRESVRRYGREDVTHVITWALRGWNPFETGPLQ